MPFTDKEIALMREIGLSYDFEHQDALTDDDWNEIVDAVADRLVLRELDENYYPTPDGVICEDILEKVARR